MQNLPTLPQADSQTNVTYGAEFLDALDRVTGGKYFSRSERAALRDMDRAGVVKMLQSYRYEWSQAATELSPEELALQLDEVRQSVASRTAISVSVCLLSVSLLLLFLSL